MMKDIYNQPLDLVEFERTLIMIYGIGKLQKLKATAHKWRNKNTDAKETSDIQMSNEAFNYVHVESLIMVGFYQDKESNWYKVYDD